jgi:[lysine-biosynthesis-protein LysW]--L-2-aminoadipate ligase
MSSTADVLLSVTMLRPDEKLLLQAIRATGLEVQVLLPADVGEVLNAGGSAGPQLAVIRNLSHRQAIDVARRLRYLDIRTLNSASAIEVCNDKGLQALLFAGNGVAHPVSRHAFSYQEVRDAAETLGWPAVLKPVSGSWGRGVTKLSDPQSVDAWAGGHESVDAAGKNFPVLVQQYIDKPGHDLRVVVIGRKPVVAIRRSSADWRTNTHLGATVTRVEISPEIQKRCTQVVDLIGDGFYGIDLITDRDTGELLVLEVNANPEFAKSSAVHGVDIAAHLASYLSELLACRRDC